jgi:hypothetical protein
MFTKLAVVFFSLSIRDGSIYIPVHVFSNVPVRFILPIVEVVLSCTPSISKEHIYMAYMNHDDA